MVGRVLNNTERAILGLLLYHNGHIQWWGVGPEMRAVAAALDATFGCRANNLHDIVIAAEVLEREGLIEQWAGEISSLKLTFPGWVRIVELDLVSEFEAIGMARREYLKWLDAEGTVRRGVD